ncbi:MAG: Gfo/Idh/MocA family oxidoreductase [Longimicrobiales bacterium]
MTEGKVRVGVLGLGAIAQVVHLPVLSEIADVELVAVCDADKPKARAIAARFGIPHVFASDEEVFKSDLIDALVICTPSHLHEPQAIAALDAGKHVLVEKPLALSADACARVVAAAERAGKVLMVAMNNRFRPDSLALKPFVAGGELGDVFLARGAWLNRKVRVVRPTWRHRKATAGGGAMMDLGVQTLDLAMWMLGFPVVKSICTHFHYMEGMEVEDSAAIIARLANGGGITLTVSWSLIADRDRHYMRLLGTKGSGAISPLGVFKEMDHGLLDVTPSIAPGRENVYTASYRAELSHFAAACLGAVAQEPPREQIELMKLVSLGYQSAAEGREIEA